MNLQPRYSLFVVESKHIEQFDRLLNEHHHFKILLPKFSNGTVFHWQLAFDLFHYLYTCKSKIYLNIQQLLISPFSTYLYQLMNNCAQIKYLKKIEKPDQTLLLITSLVLTIHILEKIEGQVPIKYTQSMHMTTQNIDYEDMQHEYILRFKKSIKCDKTFTYIFEKALDEANAMYHFMKAKEVLPNVE